jgi:hypothetical protein
MDATVSPASVGDIGGIKGRWSSNFVEVVIKLFLEKLFIIGVISGVEVSTDISKSLAFDGS